MLILVCNAGSTSLKFKLYDFPEEKLLSSAKIERIGDDKYSIFHFENHLNNHVYDNSSLIIKDYVSGISLFLNSLIEKEKVIKNIKEISAVGFKTVISKGYNDVHIITDEVIKGMEEYLDIAKVHNTCYISVINAFRNIDSSIPLVGVFETSFHKTISKEKYTYPIPLKYREKFNVRKYGYHGSSHEYSASLIKNKFGDNIKHISLHLGGSSSACAIYDGKSVDSSFAMSLQTGLMHAYRSGDVDSFIFPFLLNRGYSLEEIENDLAKEGGLKGIYLKSGDVRDILDGVKNNDENAVLALDMFAYYVKRYIGSFMAILSGVDVISFSGGIGEKSPYIRNLILKDLSPLGIELDNDKNENIPSDGIISKDSSKVKIVVVNTDEEIIVSRKTYKKIYG
ncbi:MAG: acetate/propionate family kinase [Bacilli bacterium]